MKQRSNRRGDGTGTSARFGESWPAWSAVLVFLLFGSACASPEPPPSARPGSRGPGGVTARIEPAEQVVTRNDPVPLRITYTNGGPEPIVLWAPGRSAFPWLAGEVLDVRFEEDRARWEAAPLDGAITLQRIEPGASWVREIPDLRAAIPQWTSYNGRAFEGFRHFPVPFDEDGYYDVQLAFTPAGTVPRIPQHFRGTVESDSVRVRVKE